MPILTTEQQYHLSCESCGKSWWDTNAFPTHCPYCNTNRLPKCGDAMQLLQEFLISLEHKSVDELRKEIEQAREDSKDSYLYDEDADEKNCDFAGN